MPDTDDSGWIKPKDGPAKPESADGWIAPTKTELKRAPVGSSYMDIARREADIGMQDVKEGAGRVGASGASLWERVKGGAQMGLGAVEYVGSPLEGAARRYAADPAEILARKAGASPGLARGVGQTVDIGSQVASGGIAKKLPGMAREVPDAIRAMIPGMNKAASKVGDVARGTIDSAEDVIKRQVSDAARRKADKLADAAPTREKLRTASQEAFAEASKIGANVHPDAYGRFVEIMPDVLKAEKITSGDIPISRDIYKQTKNIVERLEDYRGHELTLENLQTLQQESNEFVRKALNKAKGDRRAADVRGTTIVSKQIGDFVENLKSEDVVSGDPEKAIPILNKAKELWRRQSKMNTVENILDVAKDLRSPDYIKQEFRNLRKDPIAFKSFTPKEQQLINEIGGDSKLESVVDHVPGMHRAKAGIEVARTIGGGRMKKAQELMDLIARGEEAQKAAPGPSFANRINEVLRPGPPNSASRRFPYTNP